MNLPLRVSAPVFRVQKTPEIMTLPFARARFALALGLALFSGLASLQAADVEGIIAKARAYLGPDAALNGIQSIQYTGKLAVFEGVGKEPKISDIPVEIIFQKPFRQRIMASFPNRAETTVLDGYDAWQYIQDAVKPSVWKLDLMLKDATKRLRANTWENLAFYRGLEKQGGQIEDLGDVSVDGVVCRKLAFRHEPGIVFVRYFEKATGHLIVSETEQGSTIREEGEIMVNGIRFPKKVITTSRRADGTQNSIVVTFDKITVNGKIDDQLFAMPAPR